MSKVVIDFPLVYERFHKNHMSAVIMTEGGIPTLKCGFRGCDDGDFALDAMYLDEIDDLCGVLQAAKARLKELKENSSCGQKDTISE